MIRVKFYKLKYRDDIGGPGEPAEIDVPTNDFGVAFEAACQAGGDPSRKMLYKIIQ